MTNPVKAYGCYNRKPFPTHAYVQDGWVSRPDPIEAPAVMIQARKMVRIPLKWEGGCQYDDRPTDPKCAGCKHLTGQTTQPDRA